MLKGVKLEDLGHPKTPRHHFGAMACFVASKQMRTDPADCSWEMSVEITIRLYLK